MPGRKWYLIAVGILFLGGLLAAGFAFLRLRGLTEDLPQVVVPGSAEIELDEAGGYTIYHESPSVVDGRYYSASHISGLTVEVVSVESGEPVPLESPTASTSYGVSGRTGTSILAFDIDEPGRYRVTGSYDGGGGPETVLAVGNGIGTRILITVLGALGIGFLAFGLALTIAIVTFVKRRRARRGGGAAPPPVGTTAPVEGMP